MANEIKSQLHEEALRKFKHRVDYKVNESPKYRPIIGMDEVFDELPQTNEVGEEEDALKPAGGEVPPAPSNDQPVGAAEAIPAETPVPSFDNGGEGLPAPVGGETPPASPTPQVDDIQNEIIKHNIEAMKSIHDQLESLNTMTQSLNAKLGELTTDVEEVREPTNGEQLMLKKEVSQPYYYNLNDFWSGNWFNQQREKEASKGIRELPDGTYIADFDDLPQQSKIDVQNSFNDIS